MTAPEAPAPPVHHTAPNAFGGPAAKLHTACGAKMAAGERWLTTTAPQCATCPACLRALAETAAAV